MHVAQAPGTLPSKHQTRSEEPGRAGSCAEADVADSVEGEVQHVDFSCSELDPEEADWIEVSSIPSDVAADKASCMSCCCLCCWKLCRVISQQCQQI